MKLHAFLILILVSITAASAQDSGHYAWPIQGAEPGDNIICGPQGYIDGEFNFDDLFIGAPEGTTVVSPVDGTIEFLSLGYRSSLSHSSGWGCEESFDKCREKILPEMQGSPFANYVYGTISINPGGGRRIYISGLAGDQQFKTGQKLSKGEPIGKVGYSYHKILEPSINVSISQNSRADDPMSPFGIRTTFIPPKSTPPVTSLTKEQAKEDFLVYMEVLKEAFPGLYYVITKEELEKYITETIARIDSSKGDLKIGEFGDIMYQSTAKINDSHIWMSPEWMSINKITPSGAPRIRFGWIEDILVCTNAPEEMRELVGREISSVNGKSADVLKTELLAMCAGYDMQADEYAKSTLATFGFAWAFPDGNFDMDIVFADGEQMEIKAYDPRKEDPEFIRWRPYMGTNWYPEGYTLKILNDSTAYIGLTHFGLNQTQVDEISTFVGSIAEMKNLIIDVRNNGGGNGEVIDKIFSFIAQEPYRLTEYSKVNKKGFTTVSKYSMNYTGIDEIFPDFEAVEGKEGFYAFAGEELSLPDADANFKGKVYVLINESSASAATLFPAAVIKYRRGAVIGRETRTGYHHMVAVKFADIRLPNSGIVIKVPLVQSVFDSTESKRNPFGRGAMPDYHVPLTLDEMGSENGDAILNYTLQLIEQGKYLPEPEEEEGAGFSGRLPWLVGGGAALVAVVVIASVRRKKK